MVKANGIMKGYCTMLSIGSYGRFANAAFQIAGVLGVSRKNGLVPVFPQWCNHDARDRFGSKEEFEIQKHFVNHLPALPEGVRWIGQPVQWGYYDVRLRPGNWNLSGHFQSFKYFEHCSDEVKWYLKMHNEVQNDFCALHYRAGDYQKGPGAYHPRMPIEYYERAIDQFPADQKYMVFSDDKDEVIKLCNELRIDFDISPGKDYLDDFRIMKCSKDFIIANSSYSALAAWLGRSKDKKVISPSGYNWFGDVAQINGNDIVHPEWVAIRFDKNNKAVA